MAWCSIMLSRIAPVSSRVQHFVVGQDSPRKLLWLAPWFALQTTTAHTADYLTYEQTAPGSVDDVPTSIEGLAGPMHHDVSSPVISEPDLESPFWRDTSLDLKIRSYYLERNRDQGTDSLAWTLGGWLTYRSGLWRDRLGLGASLYTTQGLHAPDHKPGSGLLEPEQEGFTVLGEAFVDLRLTEQLQARLFRHTFDVPYVNKRDIRMVPNTFEAYLLFDETDEQLNYVLGHVRKIKTYASDRFEYMSEAAGADGSNDGVTMGGALSSSVRARASVPSTTTDTTPSTPSTRRPAVPGT